MKVFNGIIGVVAIFGALRCILLSGTSFLNFGWIVALILLLWGISAIATYIIDKKEANSKNANLAATGVFGLVFGIAACIISIVSATHPLFYAFCLLLIFVVFLIFMFVSGVREIIYAMKLKKSEKPEGWGVSLTIGIILLIVAVGGLISWMSLHVLTGVNLGIMLGVFGIAMLISVFEQDNFNLYDELED